MNLVNKPGYWIEFALRGEKQKYKHVLGGQNKWHGAYCLTCMRPLLLLLTLDPKDPKLKIARSPWKGEVTFDVNPRADGEMNVKMREPKLTALPLFYCWTCLPQLTYRLNHYGGVDVLNHDPQDSKETSPPSEDQPEFFPPRKMKLIPVTGEEQSLLEKHNRDRLSDKEENQRRKRALFLPRHQVWGEPYLVQKNPDDQGGSCAVCKEGMPLFLALGDDSGTKGGFVNNAFVQLLFAYCTKCQVLDVHNECD